MESARFKIIFDKMHECQSDEALYKDVFEIAHISKEIEDLKQIIFSINQQEEPYTYTKT